MVEDHISWETMKVEHMLEDEFSSIVGGRQLPEVDEVRHLAELVYHRHDGVVV